MDISSRRADFLHMKKNRDPGIAAAVAAAGSQKALAEFLGLRKSNISMWSRVPAKHVPAISQHFGITRHELRPDLWRPSARTYARRKTMAAALDN